MFNEITEDLIFISKIPGKSKPNFSDRSFTSTDEWFSTIKRRYKAEKGEKGVIHVDNMLDQIEKHWKNIDQKEFKRLLSATEKGFHNLVNTYTSDQQPNVAAGYLSCWKRVKVLLEDNRSKKFFDCSPKMCVSEHSQVNNK